MPSRPTLKQQLAKKAQKQRNYRKRLKDSRRPSREDISVALLVWIVRRTKKQKDWTVFNHMMGSVARTLEDRGFDKTETEKAIDALVERIEEGWDFQPRRRGDIQEIEE